MKMFFYPLFLMLGMVAMLSSVQAKSIKAYFNYSVFNTPDNKPFVETHLSVFAYSLNLSKNQAGKFQGVVAVELKFSQNGVPVNGLKYNLNSPEFEDTLKTTNFIDQQRFELAPGKYLMELSVADANNLAEKPFSGKDSVLVEFNPAGISVSSVQFVESFSPTQTPTILSKSGYDLVPYVSSFYPENLNKLSYYTEFYGTDKVAEEGAVYVLSSYLENYESLLKLSGFGSVSKQSPKPVIVLFNEFNITDLPSGNYYLVAELKNRKGEVVALRKAFFQRSNPKAQTKLEDIASISIANTFAEKITNLDTLKEYVRCLSPISNQQENTYASNAIKSGDLLALQKYFYNFWQNKNKLEPEQAWLDYNDKVKYVQKKYATNIKKGYMTDRGRVYLKYGPPSQISQFENEPSNYPYEIWQYYQMDQRNNRKFVFYNPDLVTNDYPLLHSDVIGERRDDRWRVRLAKRNNAVNNFDNEKANDSYGNKADDFYNNPR